MAANRCLTSILLFSSMFICCLPELSANNNVHTSYLWHLQQPIYWPARNASGKHYEYVWESMQAKDRGRKNPLNNLGDIFGKDDRKAIYQWRSRDCIGKILWSEDAGAQINYSGCLIENVNSLGEAGQLGYSSTWKLPLIEARNWKTSAGFSRADIVLFTYHHALPGLIAPEILRKEIEIYKAIYADTWGKSPVMSKGFFPAEVAFSERNIPILVEMGIDWVVVSNSHISRACENFPLVYGTGGENTEPPNKADQINPPQQNWFRQQISRGCAPANAYPFSMRPHYAKYVDPASGKESRIIVVPTEQAMSWKDGYGPYGTQDIDGIAAANNQKNPMLILLTHDGDNAFAGGYSYYMECVPNFVQQVAQKGYSPTTIQQYLHDHPVDKNDIVHVEDGAWVNADGDMGSPSFSNWNWPLMNKKGEVDPQKGWAEDERNWAVYTAAVNRVVTAEQMHGKKLDPRKIAYPWWNANDVEHAWHYLLGGTASGYMYYGKVLDMEVKPTVACNESVKYADKVIKESTNDLTPPTIWIPQRYPYNPGEINYGAIYRYKKVHASPDFWIWTFIYDVSGIKSVFLKYRPDKDGKNPLSSNQNEIYKGGAEVGNWKSILMKLRKFPKGNHFNDPEIDFSVLPEYIANEYYLHVNDEDLKDVLIDYYIEARDQKGNIARSPIQHCWIGAGPN
ncbi:hypothetical protein ACFL35_13510 [Candidatus Riflebacteria bacterium]